MKQVLILAAILFSAPLSAPASAQSIAFSYSSPNASVSIGSHHFGGYYAQPAPRYYYQPRVMVPIYAAPVYVMPHHQVAPPQYYRAPQRMPHHHNRPHPQHNHYQNH